ncbi:MAG: flagellin lysine-N-methylase, partial [Ignavibacteriales bacterium]
MSSPKQTVLMPNYLRDFSCIGSDCEDSCCAGWQVHIDRNTYKKYNKIRHSEIKSQLNANIKRIRSNPTERSFAKMQLRSDSSCPFLSSEKLCGIQLNLGESYLSDVCFTYPRVYNHINGVLEKSAVISCPEIARLVLLNPKG